MTSGSCEITVSGKCPFNLSILIGPPDVTTGVDADAVNSFAHVPSPTIPSAVNPFFVCQSFTAFSVPVPNVPSGDNPSFSCNFLTSSPFTPTLSNILFSH